MREPYLCAWDGGGSQVAVGGGGGTSMLSLSNGLNLVRGPARNIVVFC